MLLFRLLCGVAVPLAIAVALLLLALLLELRLGLVFVLSASLLVPLLIITVRSAMAGVLNMTGDATININANRVFLVRLVG